MPWPFSRRRREEEARDENQRRKIAESQMALLEAATTTADAAHHVTNRLRQHLEDSIRQFETVFRLMADGLFVCDGSGAIQTCNPAAEIMFAADAKTLAGTPISSLFRVGDSNVISGDAFWQIVDSGGLRDEGGLSAQRRNGEAFAAECSFARLDRHDGSHVFIVLVRDLSVLSETSRLAVLHEARFAALFSSSFDGILIVQDGRIVAANPAAGILFNRKQEALLRMSFDNLVDAADRRTVSPVAHVDDAPGSVEIGTLRQGENVLHLLFSSTAIQWNDRDASLITVKDVSEMRRLESLVRNRRDNNIDMIVCFDPSYRVVFVNEPFCRYYESTHEKLIGADIRALMTDSERNAFMLNLGSLTPESPTRRVQVQLQAGSAGRWQDWIDHATFDDNGNIVEFQRTGRDVTEVLDRLMRERGNRESR